jgi:hypothetical protein
MAADKATMNFSEETVELIIDKMCEGQTLAAVCRENGITRRTVYKWLQQHPSFANQYAIAQQMLADHLFDEILEICDGLKPDPNADNKSNWRVVDAARLKIESRKYLCSRLHPLRYHEQQGIALNVNLNKKLDEMTDRELLALRERYLALPPPKTIEAQANE